MRLNCRILQPVVSTNYDQKKTFMRAYIRWLFCCFGYIPTIEYRSEPQPFTED